MSKFSTRYFRVILHLLIFVMPISDSLCQEKKSLLRWEIAYHQQEDLNPVKWLPSIVPGAVQLDVMKAENYKQPYWYGDNFKQFDWMEDWFFTYRTLFKRPELQPHEKLYFHSKGIDYHYKIILNDVMIYEHEGMFSYVDIDLTDKLTANNELKIVLFPIPKIEGAKDFIAGTGSYRGHASESAKPAVSYGWDWHPRLVTRGIWDETYLLVRNKGFIEEADITYNLNQELSHADLNLNLKGKEWDNLSYNWILKNKSGGIVFQKTGEIEGQTLKVSGSVEKPELWWPNGYGDPVLYSSEVVLLNLKKEVIDRKEQKVGFRTVKLIMNDGEWEKPAIFPVTRNRAPASLEINGKRIFAKGTNWVHPEIFVGTITKELYEKQIQLAKDANFNILRVWGGGIVNKESFFDLCDEKGLLVWQEFPLACNNYTDDKKYLKVLEQEATAIIKRVKQHPCLVIWSGGNELFNSWGGMTDQSLALRLLNSLCYQLDPKTPFIPTSPLYGMGHGSYVFFDKSNSKGTEVFQWMAQSDNTAYPEFGIPGTANIEVLKKFIPKNELFPPKRGTAWESHHAFGAWRENSWLELPFLEEYFGKINSLEDLVKYSQLTQSEGLKFIYEESRRQKPYCSMALNWCFQEPWPTAANNSLINWPNILKPAYYSVADACRPVLASIRAPKFLWNAGDEFNCELFMLNDSYEALKAERIKLSLVYDNKEIQVLEWDFEGSGEFENSKGPVARVKLPAMKNNLFVIKIQAGNNPKYNSEYVFLYKPAI